MGWRGLHDVPREHNTVAPSTANPPNRRASRVSLSTQHAQPQDAHNPTARNSSGKTHSIGAPRRSSRAASPIFVEQLRHELHRSVEPARRMICHPAGATFRRRLPACTTSHAGWDDSRQAEDLVAKPVRALYPSQKGAPTPGLSVLPPDSYSLGLSSYAPFACTLAYSVCSRWLVLLFWPPRCLWPPLRRLASRGTLAAPRCVVGGSLSLSLSVFFVRKLHPVPQQPRCLAGGRKGGRQPARRRTARCSTLLVCCRCVI